MTSRERFSLLVIDEQSDRCNVMPLITSHAATVSGIPLKRYYTDGQAMAEAQIIAIEKYRHDAISIFSEVGIIAEALGSEFIYPDDDLPVLKTPVLNKSSITSIKIPDPKSDGRLPLYLEAIDYTYKAVGDRIPILAYVPAPFTTGMMLAEPEKFLIATIKNSHQVKEIMEICLQAAIEFSYEIIDAGGLPIIVDPLASASVISPKTYKEFAWFYEKKLIDFLHRYDLDVILHICGDTTPIIDLLPETKADLISIDQVDLSLIRDKIGGKMRLIGNFDTSLLTFGDSSIIIEKTQEMVKEGMKNAKGYIAATGCEVPIKTPEENVKAFITAAKEAGLIWQEIKKETLPLSSE